MGIAFDGSVNLVASGLTLFSGTPSIALACWARNPAVAADTSFVKLRNSGATAFMDLLGQSNTVMGVNYQASAGNNAFKASGDDVTATWKPVMGLAYSSTGGSTIDRLRFWSGTATSGVEDSITPLTNVGTLLTVIEVGVGDSSEVGEIIALSGMTLAEAQTFWTAFKGGALPETIDAAHTVTHASLLNLSSLALSGGGTLATTGGGTASTSGTHPISRTSPPIITGPSGAAGAASSTANLAELATTGPTFTTSTTLGGGYPTLTGADAASFVITALTSTNFRVDPATPFNFESLPHANPFNVTFNASASVSQTCAISITNVNEAPTFSGTISVPSLTEGVAMSAINAATLFSDPDSGDTGSYTPVGTWPTGITVSSGGLISGTPGAGTAATYSSLRVRRTDGGGLTADSNVFAITVSAAGAAPGVTTQPSNQTVTEGGVATFTAAFSNAPTGFAWEFSDSPYSSWSPVVGGSGATTASYTTVALSLANSGRRFRCRGTNAFGSTNTNGTAQVTVNAAPAFSALTDIIGEAGIALAGGTTVYWTWFPSGRPGAMVNPVQGSGVVNSAGRATISHSVAGDGLVVIGRRPGPAVANDRLFMQFLTLA